MSEATSRRRFWRFNRKKTFITVFLSLLAFFLSYSCFMHDYHWIIIGYWKNQPTYKGFPADYWKARLHTYDRQKSQPSIFSIFPPDIAYTIIYLTGVSPGEDYPLPPGDSHELAVLLFLLKDGDPDIRQHALRALQALNPLPEEAINPILVVLREQSDARSRAAVAMALCSISPPPEEAMDALIAALDDPDADVRSNFAFALGSCGPAARRAAPKLFELWNVEYHPGYAGIAVPEALLSIAPEEMIEALVNGLDNPEDDGRLLSIYFLTQHERAMRTALPKELVDKAVPKLVDLLKNPELKWRLLARDALEKIAPEEARKRALVN